MDKELKDLMIYSEGQKLIERISIGPRKYGSSSKEDNEIGVYVGKEQRSQKPIVFNVFDRNNDFLGIAGKGRNFPVSHTLEDINELYPRHCRSIEHRLKSNNWLKFHKMVMRRKPFKLEKKFIMIDEAHLLFRN